jgi:hypothetical protein
MTKGIQLSKEKKDKAIIINDSFYYIYKSFRCRFWLLAKWHVADVMSNRFKLAN